MSTQKNQLEARRHSCEHVLMQAMYRFYPEIKMAMGPPIATGFYFDFDPGKHKISEADFPKIEAEMAKIIKMPVLGIAIANISINEWFIEVGDKVSQGQPLLEVQTDKITMEVPSEESGSLLKIFFDKDAQLTDGVPIAIIGEPGENIDSLITQVNDQLQGLDLPQPELESPAPS